MITGQNKTDKMYHEKFVHLTTRWFRLKEFSVYAIVRRIKFGVEEHTIFSQSF